MTRQEANNLKFAIGSENYIEDIFKKIDLMVDRPKSERPIPKANVGEWIYDINDETIKKCTEVVWNDADKEWNYGYRDGYLCSDDIIYINCNIDAMITEPKLERPKPKVQIGEWMWLKDFNFIKKCEEIRWQDNNKRWLYIDKLGSCYIDSEIEPVFCVQLKEEE